jgi:hypothetical protein
MPGLLGTNPLYGALYEPQPTGILSQPQPQGLLGAATVNPLMARQIAAQRATNPRPDVTDFMGYGPTWQTYLQNMNQNLQAQMMQPGDSGDVMVQKSLGMLGNFGGFGVTAFHGSPHKFSKFDVSKVAPGDRGGTSFGLGINLSKDPRHANAYKDGGYLYRVDLPDEELKSFIKWEQPVGADLAKQLPPVDFTKPIPFGGGATLENVDGQWFLKSGTSSFRLRDSEVDRMFGEQNTGEQVYRRLVAALGGDERAASNWLKDRGVKGIINNTERNAENYVVFDDQLPKILGRE